jgi:hypothetical protein
MGVGLDPVVFIASEDAEPHSRRSGLQSRWGSHRDCKQFLRVSRLQCDAEPNPLFLPHSSGGLTFLNPTFRQRPPVLKDCQPQRSQLRTARASQSAQSSMKIR